MAQIRHQEDLSGLVAFAERRRKSEMFELSNAGLRGQEQVASQLKLEAGTRQS